MSLISFSVGSLLSVSSAFGGSSTDLGSTTAFGTCNTSCESSFESNLQNFSGVSRGNVSAVSKHAVADALVAATGESAGIM